MSADAVESWRAVRRKLRRRLGAAQGEIWIDAARLVRVMSGNTLLVALPPKGRTIYGALQHKSQIQSLCRQAGFDVALTVYPDEWQIAQARKRFGVDLRFLD